MLKIDLVNIVVIFEFRDVYLVYLVNSFLLYFNFDRSSTTDVNKVDLKLVSRLDSAEIP